MSALFYVSAFIAVISGLLVVTQISAMRALINLIVLLLAVASVFYSLGAPFVAVLQIIIYAGAIMVLFVFAIMMLNLGREAEIRERSWIGSVLWAAPLLLSAALLAQFSLTVTHSAGRSTPEIGPKAVGISLFTDYLIGVELASLLLLAALIAAFHYGRIASRSGGDDE